MKIFCLLLLLLCSMNSMSQEKIPFEIRDGHFYRYGETTPILSGEMHYARIPHQYWRHRLQMMKGMGLNTVATYVFWNLHCRGRRDDGHPSSRTLCLCRVGIRRVSLVAAEYTRYGNKEG